MNEVERGELYLRLRAERLLDTTHSAWREVDTGAVQQIMAIAEALVALRVIDNTALTSVLSDLELAGWLRQRVLSEITRIQAVLSEAFSPPRPTWPPSVLACPVSLQLGDHAELHLCWLTRRGRGGPTDALIRIVARLADTGPDYSAPDDLPARLGLDQLVLVDDRGSPYSLGWDEASEHPLETGDGDGSGVIADFVAAVRPEPPSTVHRLELRVPGAADGRVECGAPVPIEFAKRPHQSARPGQVYLANLLGLLPHGVAAGAEKASRARTAAIAGALVDLGLVRADDDLVLRAQRPGTPAPPTVAAPGSATDGPASEPIADAPVRTRAVGRELDLRGARIFVEGYLLSGGHLTVYLQLAEGQRRVAGGFAGPPWFGLIDDHGRTYRLSVRSENGREANVSLPGGLDPAARMARFFIETPFESAWFDLDLDMGLPPDLPHDPAPDLASAPNAAPATIGGDATS
jgi:hypothetical protein